MNRSIRYLFFLCLFVVFGSLSYAQEGQYIEVRDLETWTGAQLKYKWNDQLAFGLKGQLRLDRNSSELESYLSEFETKYNVNKHFQLALGLRFSNKLDNEGNNQGFEQHFRYHLDASYKHDIKRFNLEYRLRYQNRNEIGVSTEQGDVAIQNIRFKTALKYNIKNWKLDPEFSTEIFNRYEKNGQSNGFDQFRFTAGTSYKLKSIGKIGLYYRIDQEISSFYPKTTNIVLLNYSYTFKNK